MKVAHRGALLSNMFKIFFFIVAAYGLQPVAGEPGGGRAGHRQGALRYIRII